MAAVRAARPVTKSAAVSEERQLTDSVIRSLVQCYDDLLVTVEESTAHTSEVLKAIHRQGEPGSAGWVPLRAGQWRVDLAPNVPPEQMPRYDSPFSVPREEP